MWSEMEQAERIDLLKDMLSIGMSSKQIASSLDTNHKTIQSFCQRHGLKGRYQGGQEGNKNALIHGQGRNTISRLCQKIVGASGRSIYTCEICGFSYGVKAALPIHHKDGDRTNNTLDNLKVLCTSCHNLAHGWARGENGRFI